MNNVSASKIIENLYNSVLHPQWGMLHLWNTDPNVGMHFRLEITYQNNGYEKNSNTHHAEWERHFYADVHVIITARHRVYVRSIINHSGAAIPPASEWENTSNHDSEWRSGLEIIDHIMTEGWDHCFRWMLEKCPQHAPANYYYPQPSTRLATTFLGHELFQFVRVEREPIPGDHYFDRLTKITPIKHKIVLDLESQPTEESNRG